MILFVLPMVLLEGVTNVLPFSLRSSLFVIFFSIPLCVPLPLLFSTAHFFFLPPSLYLFLVLLR